MKQFADELYAERDQCVALAAWLAHALGMPVWIGQHESQPGEMWDDEWRNVVYINLPTGQVSWHIRADELEWFSHIPHGGDSWDQHTPEEKYRRVKALTEIP